MHNSGVFAVFTRDFLFLPGQCISISQTIYIDTYGKFRIY